MFIIIYFGRICFHVCKVFGIINIKIYASSEGAVSFKGVIISISFKLQCELKWSCTVNITHENTKACSNQVIIFCIFHCFLRHDTAKIFHFTSILWMRSWICPSSKSTSSRQTISDTYCWLRSFKRESYGIHSSVDCYPLLSCSADARGHNKNAKHNLLQIGNLLKIALTNFLKSSPFL